MSKCCGVPVREVLRSDFDRIHKVLIPTRHDIDRSAESAVYEDACCWFYANWGLCELEVTPFSSKLGAAYIGARERMCYDDLPEFANDFWEVWHLVDVAADGVSTLEVLLADGCDLYGPHDFLEDERERLTCSDDSDDSDDYIWF